MSERSIQPPVCTDCSVLGQRIETGFIKGQHIRTAPICNLGSITNISCALFVGFSIARFEALRRVISLAPDCTQIWEVNLSKDSLKVFRNTAVVNDCEAETATFASRSPM